MRLEWSFRARADLDDLGAFIARDDPEAARRWLGTLRVRARRAARHPGSGRRVAEFDRDDIREVLVRNYRIIYQRLSGRVVVLTVVEGHRRLPSSTDLL